MKRIIALVLALCLCLGMTALADTLDVYQSDFTAGMDGFYARSTGGAKLSVSDGALHITGRSQDWHSPGRDFTLHNTAEYSLSAEVYQDSGKAVAMMISIAHKTADGTETYENIARATVPSGQWTTLSGKYRAGDYVTNVLYVETSGAAALDYSLRNFSLTQLTAPAARDDKLPSLKEVYAELFDVGCAVGDRDTGSLVRMKFCASQFSIMTHENSLKPESIFDLQGSRKLAKEDQTAVAVNFAKARPLLNFCRDNGVKVHGHVLVWHSQTPEAFFHEDYSTTKPYVTREVMLARLENYIRLVVTGLEAEYPGVIVSWDVVNEAVSDSSSALRASNWTRVIGNDFVNQAFAFARKYAPEGTLLFYNDYSTPYEPKLTGICNLLDSLIADGNIDGYGFQCHYQIGSPTMAQMQNAFTRIADKGLLLRVSELDITAADTTETTMLRQARRYQDLFELFARYSDQLIAVQVWGVTDDRSWKSSEHPLLFDKNMLPKLAFWALTDPERLPAADDQASQPASLPVATAVYGLDAIASAPEIKLSASLSADLYEGGKVSVTAQTAWDEKNLYVQVAVKDPYLNASSANSYEQDSVEIFVDERGNRDFVYDGDDHHYRVNYKGALTIDAGFNTVSAKITRTDDGFTALFTMPFTQPVGEGSRIGFDIRYNNAGADHVRRLLNFCDASDTGWTDPSVFGLLELTK